MALNPNHIVRVHDLLKEGSEELTAQFILNFVLQSDPAFYLEIHDLAVDDPSLISDRHSLCHWLFNNRYSTFLLLEKISDFFQTVSSVSESMMSMMINMHASYLALVRSTVEEDGSLEKKISSSLLEKKGGKRQAPQEVVQEAEARQKTVLKRVKFVEEEKDMSNTASLFSAQEIFSDAFDLGAYVHVKKKREQKIDLRSLPATIDLHEIYQVSGAWAGEELVGRLRYEGKYAVLVKKRGGDEVLGYKVLSGKPKKLQ